MDAADRAQEIEERQRKKALEDHKRKMSEQCEQEYPTNRVSRYAADDFTRVYDCIDCGEQIPAARVALGHKLRCVGCQEIWERRYQ